MAHAGATTGIPTSRQKNCNACVLVKRRCDRRSPICSRCLEKKTACVYAGYQSRPEGREVAANYMENLQFGSSACSIFSPDIPLNVDYFGFMPMDSQPAPNTVESSHHTSIAEATRNIFPLIDPFTEMLDDSTATNENQWLVPTDHASKVGRPSSPVDEETQISYQKMAPFCDDVQSWHLYDVKSPLYYLVNRIKEFTFEAATCNTTPFMHRYLYKDHTPLCIIDCFSTNLLYTNRTPANMAMVMRALHRNVVELIETEMGRVVMMPAEKLARVQALFLYQIIRLFDGDVTLRVQGEKDIPLLMMWLGDLCKVRENLGDLARVGDSVVKAQPPKEWERWIFAESVRRTIFMAYSVLTLYEMMKHSEINDDYDPWAYTHRWTLSRHLWEANSSFDFYRMWKEKPHFVISNYSFENFLKYGRGDDVDEFAKILMSVYVGVDETKEFISAQEHER